MTRLSAVVWFVLVLAAGFATFKVKYAVQDIDDQLTRVRKQTVAEQQEIRVLNAEWTYLNQPQRLAALNRRFLGLVPITAQQLQVKITDIPWRTPQTAPDGVVAAAPPQAAPAHPQSAVAAAPAAFGAVAVRAVPAAPAAPAVQLATAGPSGGPASLDALIAQIAQAR